MAKRKKFKSVGSLKNAGLFTSHRAIDRFYMIVATFFAVLLVTVSMTTVNLIKANNIKLGSTAVYTPQVVFPDGQGSFIVDKVYVNEKNTQAVVWFELDDLLLSNMPTDLIDFGVYTTAVRPNNKEKPIRMKSQPTVTFNVYGQSGYGSLVYSDLNGFADEVLLTTINWTGDTLPGDGEYARAEFMVNLMASEAVEYEGLKGVDFDVRQFYIDNLLLEGDEDLRKELDDTIKKMYDLRASIDRMGSQLRELRIEGDNVKLPDLPEEYLADEIYEDVDDTLRYRTTQVYTGGLHFNWRPYSMRNGGYFQLFDTEKGNPDRLSLSRWLTRIAGSEQVQLQPVVFEWRMNDGSKFDDYVSEIVNTGDVERARKLMTDYTKAVNEYLSLKYQYQTTDLIRLFYLELGLDTIDVGTMMTDPSQATLY